MGRRGRMTFDLLIRELESQKQDIDLQKKLENHQIQFTLYPPFWEMYEKELSVISFKWSCHKFDSDEPPAIDPKTPGVYIFIVRPPGALVEHYGFVMYVGMSEDGLLERFVNGYRSPAAVKLRPHVHRMISDYGKYLYWYFLPLDMGKNELKSIESRLIGYFCDPPFNRKDRPSPIAEAVKAKLF